MALKIKTNKCCYVCDDNLPVGAAILLFTVTKNKEFTGKSCFTSWHRFGRIAQERRIRHKLWCKYKFESSSSLQKVCKENCQLFDSFSRTKGYFDSQDCEHFTICKTVTWKSFSKRLYTRYKEGEGYSSRTAWKRTKPTNDSSEKILIWIKRDLDWARKARRCCSKLDESTADDICDTERVRRVPCEGR